MGMMEQTMAGEVVEGEIFIPFMLNPAAMEVAEPLDLSPSLGPNVNDENWWCWRKRLCHYLLAVKRE